MAFTVGQYKSRQSMRQQLSYQEQMRIDSLFDKIEADMGIEKSDYRKSELERMKSMQASEISSKQRFCRGEIYYVVPENEISSNYLTTGGRPALIVSNDMNNEMNGIIEVVYLTRNPWNNLPTNVMIQSTGIKSTVLCDQICSINKKRIGKYVGQASVKELEKIDAALALSLSLNVNDKKCGSELLSLWKDAIAKNPTTVEVNMLSEEYDISMNETVDSNSHDIDSEKEIKSVTNLNQQGVTSDIVKESQQLQQKQSVDITQMPDYIRICTERDVYKQLYMDLLSKK